MKVLIISHNPITTYHNMGKTLLGLFSCFKKSDLCQLYIYPTIPDIDICNSYYRITDKDVLQSYFHFFSVKGRQIDKAQINSNNKIFENESDADKYRTTSELKRLIRDLMWNHSRWFNEDIKKWLKKESPDIIFIAPGDAELIYNIGLRIAQNLSIPIITYICDEFYFLLNKKNMVSQLRFFRLKKQIEKLMDVSSGIVAICEEIASLYREKFKKDTVVIMSGSRRLPKAIKNVSNPHILQFMGNLRPNRYYSLAHIGEMLDKINYEYDDNYELRIFSDERNRDILSCFDDIKSVKLMRFVSGEEYEAEFSKADFFVHAESFDRQSIDLVKHSVSTKIADILSSGIPLLSYAPAEIASVSYLKRNNCAVCFTDKKDLELNLKDVLNNVELLQQIANNGIEIAKQNHNIQYNSKLLFDFMKNRI